MDIYIYQQILVLEYWNLANPLGVSMQEFFVKFFFGLDLNLHLYLMVWLEIEHLHIAATTFARDFKLNQFINFLGFFWFDLNLHLDIMVWLENGHLHISANTCARALKLGKHLGGINARIFCEIFFLVWLELNIFGSTWTCTCT